MALTQLADGHYLMMVTGGSNDTLAFYRSTITDLTSENLCEALSSTWVRRYHEADRSPQPGLLWSGLDSLRWRLPVA